MSHRPGGCLASRQILPRHAWPRQPGILRDSCRAHLSWCRRKARRPPCRGKARRPPCRGKARRPPCRGKARRQQRRRRRRSARYRWPWRRQRYRPCMGTAAMGPQWLSASSCREQWRCSPMRSRARSSMTWTSSGRRSAASARPSLPLPRACLSAQTTFHSTHTHASTLPGRSASTSRMHTLTHAQLPSGTPSP
jgi:hypothetical protein